MLGVQEALDEDETTRLPDTGIPAFLLSLLGLLGVGLGRTLLRGSRRS